MAVEIQSVYLENIELEVVAESPAVVLCGIFG